MAAVAGALGAVAMPPFGFFPSLVVALSIAVWLIDGSENIGSIRWLAVRSAFWAGWWWGFGYFLASLWWLGVAFLVDAEKYAWAMPIGVVALPAVLAIFSGIGFAIARLVWPQGPLRVLALAVGVSIGEWLRAVTLTGFPWNELGVGLGQFLVLAQFASVVGLHGLTLIGVAIAAAPATIGDERGVGRWAPTALATLTLGALALFGLNRLSQENPKPVSDLSLRLLQTNISQGKDFGPDKGAEILSHYLSLSGVAKASFLSTKEGLVLLVWPESAFPFILSREAGALARISQFLGVGAALATGAASVDPGAEGRPNKFYNSILLLDQSGLLAERYDKRHLVPLGEYVPFQALLRRTGLTEFVHFPGGFEEGSGSEVLTLPGAPAALAMICYEAIFPSEWGGVRSGDASRAKWILNVTDDAWFGLTPGPYQHFALARMRSIEWGLPMARSANGGISAIVDAKGRVLASAPLGDEAAIDGRLPGALGPTVAARWGSGPFLLGLAAVLAVLAIAPALRRRR